MIAELNNKVNGINSNLSERGEDELTGNFLGNMRYLPFNRGMKSILCKCIYPSNLADYIQDIDLEAWAHTISFWPRYEEDKRRTEMDIVIELEDLIIGIEVKYLSGLSSDDDMNNIEEDRASCNQLAREAELLKKLGKNKKKLLILLAKQMDCNKIYEDIRKRNIIKDVIFGYITWQKLLQQLKQIKALNAYEAVIIQDLIDLLGKKGFESFNGFKVEKKVTRKYWSFNREIRLQLDYSQHSRVDKRGYYEFR